MRTTATVITRHDVCSLACKAYIKALTAENLMSSFQKCGIYPYDESVIDPVLLAPSSVFNKPPTETAPETDPAQVDPPQEMNPPQQVTQSQTSPDVAGFFSKRTDAVVQVKSEHPKKPRNTLSRITSGRAITEVDTAAKIIEHVATHKPKSKVSKGPKNSENNSQEAGPSNAKKTKTASNKKRKAPKPTIVEPDSDTDLSSSDGEVDIPEKDLCCACKKYTPDAVRHSVSLIFVQWAQCTTCGHWVHLKFCTKVRFVRKVDPFYCQHCQ